MVRSRPVRRHAPRNTHGIHARHHHGPRRPRAQPQGRRPRAAPRQPDRLHGAVGLGQVVAWRSTRSTPRASAATSSRCRPTPASSSGRWTSPTSTSSRGCRPAISIDQKSTSRNPRSTVGTITEIYDYLRLLYARIGTPHCPNCGARDRLADRPSRSSTRSTSCPAGTRFQVLAPVVRGRKGEYGALFQDLSTKGYARVRVDGEVHAVDEVPKLEKTIKHDIEVVVDRLVQKEDIRRRLSDSIETALQLAEGVAMVEVLPSREDGRRRPRGGRPSRSPRCTSSPSTWPARTAGSRFDQLAPRNFSFNSPYGACETCSGLGTQLRVDPELVIGDPRAAGGRGRDRARGPAAAASRRYYSQLLRRSVEHFGEDPRRRGGTCRTRCRTPSWTASTRRSTSPTPTATAARRNYRANFEGVLAQLRGATPRPTPTTSAARSSSTCGRSRARPATGRGSSPWCSAVTIGGTGHPRGDGDVGPRRRPTGSTSSS